MNVAELTCQEVNQELAKRRGWRQEMLLGHMRAPDYCHDWRWAGALFVELLHLAHFVYMSTPPHSEAPCFGGTAMTPGYTQELWFLSPFDKNEFPEAISRTRLEMYLEAESE